METAFRNVDLSVQPQPLLILHHVQIACQTGFQTKRIHPHVVTHMHNQIAVDRDPGALRLLRLQVVIEHHFIAGDAHRALWQVMNHNTRPRHVHPAIESEQTRRRFKHDIRRNIQSHHRRYGDTYPAAFRRHTRTPVVDLTPVRVAA